MLCSQCPSHKVVTWLPLRMHIRVMAALLTAQVIPSFRRELLASAFATFVTEDVVTVFHSGGKSLTEVVLRYTMAKKKVRIM